MGSIPSPVNSIQSQKRYLQILGLFSKKVSMAITGTPISVVVL